MNVKSEFFQTSLQTSLLSLQPHFSRFNLTSFASSLDFFRFKPRLLSLQASTNFSWGGIGPKKELEEKAAQAQQEEMQKRTRVAEGPVFTPSRSDVQDLLAAIAKLERKEKTQVVSQRQTPKDEDHRPHSSPTGQNWRLAKVLDSLANLCVSETNHEVIATALRVDYKKRSIELIVASNTEVQDSTVKHLRKIWETLQRISTICHKHHQLDPEENTPPRTVKDAQVMNLMTKLIQLCLEFSFSRLQKRINKKFHRFCAININNSDPQHPFQMVRRWVIQLEKKFTRDEGATTGKPRHDDTKAWMKLWDCLQFTKDAIDTFLDDGGFRPEDVAAANTFLGYESYLRKVESLTNDIRVLMKLANSPQCKQLLTFKLEATPLPGQVSKAISVPQTPKDWETVFEKALLFRNKYKIQGQENYVIDTKKMEEDTAYMARNAIKRDLVIHCEVRILLHIFKTENENENPSIPKAYTYVGVSKLSCTGCHAFFDAFNRVHETRFVTKGSHRKSYLQWQFPPSFPKSDMVLFYTYFLIAPLWVGFYDGYMVKRVSLASDSTAQTGTSGSYVPNLTPDSTEQIGTSGSHPTNQDENALLNSAERLLLKV